jgi:hypothetical protein
MSTNQKIAMALAEQVVDLLEASGASRDEQATALAMARHLISLSSASLTCLPQLTGEAPQLPDKGSR